MKLSNYINEEVIDYRKELKKLKNLMKKIESNTSKMRDDYEKYLYVSSYVKMIEDAMKW